MIALFYFVFTSNFFSFFGWGVAAHGMWDLSSPTGIEPMCCVEARFLSYWTARKVSDGSEQDKSFLFHINVQDGEQCRDLGHLSSPAFSRDTGTFCDVTSSSFNVFSVGLKLAHHPLSCPIPQKKRQKGHP